MTWHALWRSELEYFWIINVFNWWSQSNTQGPGTGMVKESGLVWKTNKRREECKHGQTRQDFVLVEAIIHTRIKKTMYRRFISSNLCTQVPRYLRSWVQMSAPFPGTQLKFRLVLQPMWRNCYSISKVKVWRRPWALWRFDRSPLSACVSRRLPKPTKTQPSRSNHVCRN